jgi:hypothetical protein
MGIMLLMSVGAARADTLQFVVSELAGSATFDLLQNPTVTSFSSGNYFTVTVNNGSINLLGYSFWFRLSCWSSRIRPPAAVLAWSCQLWAICS